MRLIYGLSAIGVACTTEEHAGRNDIHLACFGSEAWSEACLIIACGGRYLSRLASSIGCHVIDEGGEQSSIHSRIGTVCSGSRANNFFCCAVSQSDCYALSLCQVLQSLWRLGLLVQVPGFIVVVEVISVGTTNVVVLPKLSVTYLFHVGDVGRFECSGTSIIFCDMKIFSLH
jgi:hypothetical protein